MEGFCKRNLVCFGGNYLTQGQAMLEGAVEHIALLARDVSLRREYSIRLKKVADGQGASRIAQVLIAMGSGR